MLNIDKIGKIAIENTRQVGVFVNLLFQLVFKLFYVLKNLPLLIKQIYLLGNHSVLIISVSGFFVGLVLALQGYYTLSKYGSEQVLGLMVALALVREMAPVIAALLYAGRAGTSLTAEIGLMKQGEQISALDMMAVNPISYILAPRFWAGVVSLPILSILFSVFGILGGYVIAVLYINIDAGAFWGHMQSGIKFTHDVLGGLLKSFIFSIITTNMALYQGYYAKATPEGVAKATTNTVVWSSLLVLGFDFLLTAALFIKD